VKRYFNSCSGKKGLFLSFQKNLMPSKQLIPVKAENPKKRKVSLLSMDINLTHSSGKMKEYSFHYPYYK
jgi:hypothetical protein